MKATKNKTQSIKNITRHLFRVPVGEQGDISALIAGQPFQVINLVANGLGILLENEIPFEVDQKLESIDLSIGEETLHLKGKVIHISPSEFQVICGIEFVKTSKKDEKKIIDYLQTNKEKLLG